VNVMRRQWHAPSTFMGPSLQTASISIFFYGDATLADLQFDAGGLGFFMVDIDAQADDDDQKSTDN
jgi:hypothetical protein